MQNKIPFPFYKNIYVLDVDNIRNLVAKFTPNIRLENTDIKRHMKSQSQKSQKLQKYYCNDIDDIVSNRATRRRQPRRGNGKYVIIVDKWENNYELNNLTDYFSEKERILCKFGDKPLAMDAWKTWPIGSSKNTLETRDRFYKNVRVCNNFRITVALAVLQMFGKPRRWLDISAGWGDRLLAALLCGHIDLYYSTDPNKRLQKCYKKMIATFAATPADAKKFVIKTAGFERVKIPHNDFDIVFSSPPFFDLERYSEYADDSITQFATEPAWCEYFLLPCVTKAGEHLRIGGIIVLYIGASAESMRRLFETMKEKSYMYCGTIYFYDTRPRGMYVWKRTA